MEQDINTRYCRKCLHFDGDTLTCSAFPMGIPVDLLSGKVKHLSKFPEQVGKDVFVNSAEYWEKEGLQVHWMEFGGDIEVVGD